MLLALVPAGCASVAPATSATVNGRDHRGEIASLESRIAQLRDEYGLGGPPPAALQPAPPTVSARCRKVADAAEAIVAAAERICVLADELAEDDAHRRCERARADGRLARAHATACR